MDFLPWTTFARIVRRYHGNRRVRRFPCTQQFRALAFGQITGRTSLRGLTTCLAAQPAKLYHCGFTGPVRLSTLARANERRDWRIHADFAQRLMARARALHSDTPLDVGLADTIYALDSSTIDLCLSLFPWANFAAPSRGSNQGPTRSRPHFPMESPEGRHPCRPLSSVG